MRAAIVEKGVIANIIEVESLDFMPGLVEVTFECVGWVWDGNGYARPPVPAPSVDQIKSEIMAATQQRLDTFAGTRDYNSILSACTYATSAVPQFKRDGQYCVNARDATWGQLYTMLAEVEAGTRPMPTGYADIEAELPVLAWPTT